MRGNSRKYRIKSRYDNKLTWANQTRILKESFKQVGTIVGEVIINAIKPFVIALNSALGSVISFTRTVADALGKIFGWSIEIDTGGVTNDMEDASDSMEDFADDEDDAADSAKKLKKQLAVLPFDELNQLAKDLDEVGKSKNSKGDGLDDILTTDGLSANFVKGEGLFDKYKSDIDSLYELGGYIGDTLKEALASIKWDEIYQKASGFGSGLASFLNGLISPELFAEIGKTVAGVLNTALHFLDDFGNDFEWDNFGASLASGLKSFLGTYDWDLRVDTFNTFANGILDAMIAALGSVSAAEWQRIPQKIADMIGAIDASGIGWKLGDIANSLANAFYQLVANKVTWAELGKKIGEGINSFLEGMSAIDPETKMNGWEALGADISNAISGILISITKALETVEWDKVGQAIADFIGGVNFGEIGWHLGKLGNALANALYDVVSTKEIWSNLGNNIASGINNFFSAMNNINEDGFTGWQMLGKGITEAFSGIASSITTALEGVKWEKVGQAIADFIGSISFGEISWNLGSLANSLVNAFYALVSNKDIWSNLGNNITSGINTFLLGMGKVNKDGLTGWEMLGKSITSSITGIASSITTALEGVHWEDVGQAIVGFISNINFGEIGWNLGNLVNSLVSALYELVSNKESWASLGSGMANGINNFFNTINWESVGLTLDGLFSGIVTFISNLAETGNWEEIGRNIGTALSGVDWAAHLAEAASSIASILGDLLKGLAETPVGKWIIGIGAALTGIKLATHIYAFVDGIATILGGDRNTRILTSTMESLLGGATATAAGTAATAVGEIGTAAETAAGQVSLLGTGLSAIGGASVLAGLVLGTGKIAEFIEKLKGGNGELSEMGRTMDTIADEFSPKLEEKIRTLTDQLEDQNTSSQTWAQEFAALFIQEGVSADTLSDKFSALATSVGLSADEQDMFLQMIDLVAQGTEGTAERVEASGIKTEDAYNGIRDAIGELVQKGDILKEQSPTLISFLDGYEQSGDDAATAFSQLATEMDNAGISADPLITLLKEKFPDAFKNADDSVKGLSKSIDGAETSTKNLETTTGEKTRTITSHFEQMTENSGKTVTEGVGTIKKEFDNDLSEMDSSADTHLGNIGTKTTDTFGTVETESDEKWGSSKDSVTGALSTIDEETKDKMNSVMTLIQQKWSSVLINTNQIWEKAAQKVGTETGNMESSVKTTVDNIIKVFTDNDHELENAGKSMINSLLSGMSSPSSYDISNKLSSVIFNIKSAFNISYDMYTLGQNAGQSFANGLQNVHIKTPRMYISEWEKHDLGNGSWMSTPKFSIQWLARGGLVTGLTSAILGEGGRKEAVLPLENPRAMKQISAGIISGMQNLPIGQYRLASTDDMKVGNNFSKYAQGNTAQMRNSQIDNTGLMDAITGAVMTAMMNNQQNPVNVTCYAELKTENDEVLARAVTRGQRSLDYRYNATPKFGY